jgi:hypothetical protein
MIDCRTHDVKTFKIDNRWRKLKLHKVLRDAYSRKVCWVFGTVIKIIFTYV